MDEPSPLFATRKFSAMEVATPLPPRGRVSERGR